MEPCKGLFWWTGEKLICVGFSCGETGNVPGDDGPLAGLNNHRRAWEKLPRTVTQGKPFDYYPRGRVELRRGRVYLFLPPPPVSGGCGPASQGSLWSGADAGHAQSGRQPALPLLLGRIGGEQMVNYFPSLDSRDIREHLEECFAALKPISQYMKGNLPEDLFLNSVLALLHPPREGA